MAADGSSCFLFVYIVRLCIFRINVLQRYLRARRLLEWKNRETEIRFNWILQEWHRLVHPNLYIPRPRYTFSPAAPFSLQNKNNWNQLNSESFSIQQWTTSSLHLHHAKNLPDADHEEPLQPKSPNIGIVEISLDNSHCRLPILCYLVDRK